jgi:hypothetical protein
MANELTLTCRLAYTKGSVSLEEPTAAASAIVQRDVTGADVVHHVQQFDAAGSAVENVDVVVGGYIYMRNVGTVEAVIYNHGGGDVEVLTLGAGDVALFRTGDDFLTDYLVKTAAGIASILIAWIDA